MLLGLKKSPCSAGIWRIIPLMRTAYPSASPPLCPLPPLPLLHRPVLLVTQHDVTVRMQLETMMARLTESQLAMLCQVCGRVWGSVDNCKNWFLIKSRSKGRSWSSDVAPGTQPQDAEHQPTSTPHPFTPIPTPQLPALVDLPPPRAGGHVGRPPATGRRAPRDHRQGAL